ncbi:MAG TPA: hypothetical protein VLI93_08210 [Acetobacteraceae bacterium]|nr:hypothetical protein [Acetobacteraceae bacterium]
MTRRIDLEGLYADALDLMPETIDGPPPAAVPGHCPVTLSEILADD